MHVIIVNTEMTETSRKEKNSSYEAANGNSVENTNKFLNWQLFEACRLH